MSTRNQNYIERIEALLQRVIDAISIKSTKLRQHIFTYANNKASYAMCILKAKIVRTINCKSQTNFDLLV